MVLDLRCADVHVRRCGVAQGPFRFVVVCCCLLVFQHVFNNTVFYDYGSQMIGCAWY